MYVYKRVLLRSTFMIVSLNHNRDFENFDLIACFIKFLLKSVSNLLDYSDYIDQV